MTPSDLLLRELATSPARPLLTFYDDRTGERAELSVLTFANWVAKTANLLLDGLAAQPGQRVTLHLPLHWQAAVWVSACWHTGLVAAPGGSGGDVAVVSSDPEQETAAGEAGAPPPWSAAGEVVSMGLGPMGLPRPGSQPAAGATVDYDREIHAHGDRLPGRPAGAPTAPALDVSGTTFSGLQLGDLAAGAAARWGLPPDSRILCAAPLTDADSILAALLVPLTGGPAAVLCRHLDGDRLPARMSQEQVAAVHGLPRGIGAADALVI